MARMKVRARAVDMLGRQQVAGIPTAISELFKNAHDAYAHRVEVDYYRRRDLLVLRDDGVGMNRDDFEQRWLTVGTDSKLQGSPTGGPPIDPDQPLRPVMGEKGIGRLAIAVIGPQVLVLTRAKSQGESFLTAAFINWKLFGLPGIDLSDIEIPLREFPPGQLPTKADVVEMLDELRSSLSFLSSRVEGQLIAEIRAELDLFDVDPSELAAKLPSGPDLRGSGHGVHFLIQPADRILAEDIDGTGQDDVATPLQKILLGFSNTMTPGYSEPPIRASFRDHLPNGTTRERIEGANFFTPEEFLSVDHHISGDFDEFGQFTGSVGVYGQPAVPYRVHWRGEGRPTHCGPFQINFAVVQGKPSETRMHPDEWRDFTSKAQKLGGLYIYRDGIRILPYGDSDYDFINIERRRTLNAGRYYFSYRRMIGVVSVTRSDNSKLLEKAGREGFQENKAYRQFRGILENFFVQLAADFFRDEGSAQAEEYIRIKTAFAQADELRKKRAKQVSGKRRVFNSDLESFFEAINGQLPEAELAQLINQAKSRLEAETDDSITADELLELERSHLVRLKELDEKYKVVKPRGVGLTKQLSQYWARYEIERQRLSHIFSAARTDLDISFQEATARLGLDIDARRRASMALEEAVSRERKRAKSLHSDVRRQMEELRGRVLELTKASLLKVEGAVRDALINLEGSDTSALSEAEISKLRESLESIVVRSAEEESAVLERLRDQLKSAATEDGLEQQEMLGALEDELEQRRDRDFESLQLAQMGMAIGIVHHEFQAVIMAVRDNLSRLKLWADKNPSLAKLYDEIRESYAHLDGYLSLFAPLNRRLRRQKMLISGEDIVSYLRRLLGDRMERHRIELRASAEFEGSQVEDFVSTIYPCFVNLLDNSIYWLNQLGSSWVGPSHDGALGDVQKLITLDFEGGAYVLRDSGPGIPSQDQEAVFLPGFSRKPLGSGLGLYITKNLLERSGYRLELDPFTPGEGVTFRITLPETGEGLNENGE